MLAVVDSPEIFTSPAALTAIKPVVELRETPAAADDLPAMLMFWVALMSMPTLEARFTPADEPDEPPPAVSVTAPVVPSTVTEPEPMAPPVVPPLPAKLPAPVAMPEPVLSMVMFLPLISVNEVYGAVVTPEVAMALLKLMRP